MTKIAVTASYADFKLLKSRSVFQIVLEGPIEQAEDFVTAFGLPMPGAERPVAVALLNTSVPSETSGTTVADLRPDAPRPAEATQAPSQAEGRKAPLQKAADGPGQAVPLSSGARAVQMAGILCNDQTFQKWLWREHDIYAPPTFTKLGWQEWTAKKVRALCNVESRTDFQTNELARARFHAIETAYRQATGQAAEQR